MNSRIKPINHTQLKTLRESYISLFDISLIGLMGDLSVYEADYVMDACRTIVLHSAGIQDVFVKALLVDIDHIGKETGLKYLEQARRFLE